MLLSINLETPYAERKRTERLNKFQLDERGFQDILYKTLDRIFPDDELILLMQSRRWQEEPDLMAVDRNGSLFIFELKAWESHSSNVLQVLRYGQIFGSANYDELNQWYKKGNKGEGELKDAHNSKFDSRLEENQYNRSQVFVVMTNGLDHRTREAIQYWRRSGLDIRPWVYRVYSGKPGEMLLEISAFRVEDNPYEDLAEGYYIVNTNTRYSEEDHRDMLENAKAAAYFEPPKLQIARLVKGDVVFLYQSGVGIVAYGKADGELRKALYHGREEFCDEEYFMKLRNFRRVYAPLTAAEVKQLTGVNYRFMSTMFGLDEDSGRKIYKHLESMSDNSAEHHRDISE